MLLNSLQATGPVVIGTGNDAASDLICHDPQLAQIMVGPKDPQANTQNDRHSAVWHLQSP